jgi:hypothetical protein
MDKQERTWRAEFDKAGRTQVRDNLKMLAEPRARVARQWLSDQDRWDRRYTTSASIAAIVAAIASVITLAMMIKW